MSDGDNASPLAGLSVLVVEDHFLIAEEMCALVQRLGGTVVGPMSKVSAALGALEASRPDLALLDVNLGGEEVYAVADVLRLAGTPFLFTTGYDSGSIDPRFRDVPQVEKPVSLVTLLTAIERLP